MRNSPRRLIVNGSTRRITQEDDLNEKKWWAWKDSNLRPADYESGGLDDLYSVSERVVRGLSMYISPASKIRDYPEIRYAC